MGLRMCVEFVSGNIHPVLCIPVCTLFSIGKMPDFRKG
jgi:hypothetical protein